jgi:hypothetical protein
MLEPDSILADPALRELIDFDEPAALLFLSILHFVADEADPAGIIAKLLAPFPAGSHIAISHATPDEIPEVNDVERAFDEATTPAHVRSRAWPGRRNGGRIPATRCRRTPPSRTTAWWWPAPTDHGPAPVGRRPRYRPRPVPPPTARGPNGPAA